ncbi:hypothetical protein WJS89_07020 [Sphingomicrobium sp. XHP0235]|uniref:hypothetical protein n=1 Tax=Sphingomicrobium aquimarinum TaxID=3133971 RepID=UPI0031FEDB8A
MRAFALIPAILLAGCAATPADDYAMAPEDRMKLDEELAGYVVGEPDRCLDLRLTQRQTVIDDRTVLYRDGAKRVVATFSNRCPALERHGEVLVFETFGGQVCDSDIVTSIDTSTGMQTGACGIESFVPYERAGS